MSNKVNIIGISGPGQHWDYSSAEPAVCIIGKAEDCNIHIEGDEDLSRHHCLIDINPPILTVEDLKSKNGTLVNGTDISGKEQPTLLKNGDTVAAGETIFLVKVEGFVPQSISTVSRPREESVQQEDSLSSFISELKGAKPQKTERVKEIAGFEIVSQLGEGAAGAVYLVEEPETHQQIALKTMLPDIAVDVEHKARFIRESKSMELLSHPNIVKILGSGVSAGVFYFTLEYCNGGNLEDLVNSQNTPMPYQKAIGYTLDVLEGLDYLHNVEVPNIQLDDGSVGTAMGLVHRDIKPGNILLDATSKGMVAKIADFGLAKAFNLAGLRGLTQTGALGGTMDFVCRQQIINYKYAKPEVDIWSTAAVLYYLLAGIPPRPFYKIKHSISALLETDPVSIANRRKDLPEGLVEIIDFALSDSKDLAYKTAASLKEDLERYAE
jgi:serine/threonine protein kinase